VIGTATTISPEQASGEAATPGSDVYSFGVLLFQMLTGRPPFESDKPLELLQLHRSAPPPAVEKLRPDVPAGLAVLAAAALSKDPGQRPADGDALLRALAMPTSGTTVPLTPVPHSRPGRRFRGAASAGLGLAALATAGAALALLLVHGGAATPVQADTTVPSLTLPGVTTSTRPAVSQPPTTGSTESRPTTTSTTPATTNERATTSTRASTVPPPPVTTSPGTTTNEGTTGDQGTTTDLGTTTAGTTTVVVSGP
jgi:serine/threonine-protein kinase